MWKVDIEVIDGRTLIKETREFDSVKAAQSYFDELLKMWKGECRAAFYATQGFPEYGVKPVTRPYNGEHRVR